MKHVDLFFCLHFKKSTLSTGRWPSVTFYSIHTLLTTNIRAFYKKKKNKDNRLKVFPPGGDIVIQIDTPFSFLTDSLVVSCVRSSVVIEPFHQ